MDKILDLLKPENLKIPLVLLGIALLGRSLATVRPEFGITIFGPHEQPQDILAYFNVEVERYVMTMLWPLVYAFLNSLHKGIRVSKPFFNSVIIIHIISLAVSLVWFFNFIPNNQEESTVLEAGLFEMRFSASLVFAVSLCTSLFSLLWFNKKWVIFDEASSTPSGA